MKAWKKRINEIQEIALKSTLKILEEHSSCYIKLPTGTGKTVLGAKILQNFKRVLWATDGDELVKESKDRLSSLLGQDVGLIKYTRWDISNQVTIASIKTLALPKNLLKLSPEHFDLIVFDECHHTPSNSQLRVFNYFRGKKLGLTATDVRGDAVNVKDYFINCAYELTYKEALEKKLIARPLCYGVVTKSTLDGVKTKNGDYSAQELEKKVISKDRDNLVIKSYKKYRSLVKRPKAICFCVSVSHAFRMTELFRANGIPSNYLTNYKTLETHSKKERAEVYKQFKETNNIEIICVANVLNEGKDIPDANIGLFCRPTLSPIVATQQPGRLSRITRNKKEFLALYFIDPSEPKVMLSNYPDAPRYHTEITYDFDVYEGDDELVISEIKDKIFLSYDEYQKKYGWTKETCVAAIQAFYKEKKKILTRDLTPKNGLPSVKLVANLFGGNAYTALKEAGVPYNDRYGKRVLWSKEDCDKAFKTILPDRPNLSIDDLGFDGLPPRSFVEKHYGSWKECMRVFEIKNRAHRWDKESALEALKQFKNSHERLATAKDFGTGKGLPTKTLVIKLFGPLEKLQKEYPDLFRYGVKTAEYKNIMKRGNSYRVQMMIKGKKKSFGSFPSLKLAMEEVEKVKALR